VNLIVAGRPVVVVGGGRVATRKVEGLLDAGADVTVIAPELAPALENLAASGRITVRPRAFEPADVADAWLVLTATDDPSVNRAVRDAAESAHLWVNAADDPANCSFTLMSVVRRGDLQVAIGTGGRSPALAAWLRARLTAELGPEYEVLLDLLANERESIRADGRSSEEADWQQALESGILELIRAGKLDEAKERLRTCLSSSLD
jgi:siroheme synthase-like protein